MKSYKITEPISFAKKIHTNRVNSVPSLKPKSNYFISNKQTISKAKNVILIKKHILKNNKNLYSKNLNRSAGNIFKDRKLNAIMENDPKLKIKKIKKINPLMSLDRNNNVMFPEMSSNYLDSKHKTNISNNIDISEYLKALTNRKDNNRMNNEELMILLKAKCKDIGINFRENMFLKFKEVCNQKFKNRIADFCECNFGLNSIRVISFLFLGTNRISRLDLAKNNIGNLGVEILVNSLKNSKSLVYLNIASNSITYKGGQIIFNTFINQESIIDLNLSSLDGSNRNRLTSVGIQDITIYLSSNHFIEMLNLSGNSIKNEGFFYICQGLEKNQSLQNLDISNNGINEKGLKKGLEFINTYNIHSKISNLNISNNPLSNSGIMLLTSNMRYFPNLTSLNIAYCGLEFKCLQSLLKTIQYMKRLENLNISGNNFKSDSFYLLKDYFKVFGVKYLNMSRCLLGDKGAYYLGECIGSNESLKYLNISGNSITDLGFKGFMNIFKYNKSIESFDCSCNFITNTTGREFIRSLENNIYLKSINFYDNQLNDEIGGDILNVIENNNSLIHINLSYNRIQGKTIEDINKKLKINYEKRKNYIIPELERSIRDLEFRPEQFETLTRIIIEKKNILKTAYKKLKEDEKNFWALMDKENKKLIDENVRLENLKKQKKDIENIIMEMNKENQNNIIKIKMEEDDIKKKIEEEKELLIDMKNNNNNLLKRYDKKKKEINEKIQKVENRLKLSFDRYNIAKEEYNLKDKEYKKKFNYYQDLLNPSLLIKIKKENDNKNNIEELRASKLKFRLNSKKYPLKNNNMNPNNINNLYNTTTISTGNTGQANIEEKRSFKFKKTKAK